MSEKEINYNKEKQSIQFKEVYQTEEFCGKEFEVLMHKQPRELGFRTDYYAPLQPETTYADGIREDRDVAVPISDGRTVYVDIYRPENQLEKLPVIIFSIL